MFRIADEDLCEIKQQIRASVLTTCDKFISDKSSIIQYFLSDYPKPDLFQRHTKN